MAEETEVWHKSLQYQELNYKLRLPKRRGCGCSHNQATTVTNGPISVPLLGTDGPALCTSRRAMHAPLPTYITHSSHCPHCHLCLVQDFSLIPLLSHPSSPSSAHLCQKLIQTDFLPGPECPWIYFPTMLILP